MTGTGRIAVLRRSPNAMENATQADAILFPVVESTRTGGAEALNGLKRTSLPSRMRRPSIGLSHPLLSHCHLPGNRHHSGTCGVPQHRPHFP